jgi:hypothetical protein
VPLIFKAQGANYNQSSHVKNSILLIGKQQMKIKNYVRLSSFAVFLFLLGCGGGTCPSTNIDKFLIFTGTMFGSDLRTHSDGSATVFTILPREKETDSLVSGVRKNIIFSLFPCAQASQPCGYTYNEKIIAIDVRSSQDYDKDHPAGSLLNDLIKVQQYDEGLRDTQNLDDIFPVIYPDVYNYYLEFYFSKRTNSRALHQFELDIHLDNGKTLSVRTEAIDLIKFY